MKSKLRLPGTICYEFRIASVDKFASDTGEPKHSFYEELEDMFEHFRKYYMKILLGNFNAKLGKREYFQTDNSE
jgi:hypothetical protein